MTQYPLLFRCQELVAGRGFVAHVDVRGRLVGHKLEDGGFWISGVEPGDVSASGATIREAFAVYLESLKGVLVDLALEPETFEAFRNEVQCFFGRKDVPEEITWRAAVEAVRANREEGRFLSLKCLSAEEPRGVVVTKLELDAASPSSNATPYPLALAA